MTPKPPRRFRPIQDTLPVSGKARLNWGFLGLLYTHLHVPVASFAAPIRPAARVPSFRAGRWAPLFTTALFGLWACDRFNRAVNANRGKEAAMLIGAAGTVVDEYSFRAASFALMLGLFVTDSRPRRLCSGFRCAGMLRSTPPGSAARRGRFPNFGFRVTRPTGPLSLGPALFAGVSVWLGCGMSAHCIGGWLFCPVQDRRRRSGGHGVTSKKPSEKAVFRT